MAKIIENQSKPSSIVIIWTLIETLKIRDCGTLYWISPVKSRGMQGAPDRAASEQQKRDFHALPAPEIYTSRVLSECIQNKLKRASLTKYAIDSRVSKTKDLFLVVI